MWLLIALLTVAASEVVFVLEVCRHGSRAPSDPTVCPWDQDGRWDSMWGELSPVGMRMHFLLGSELRQRYVLNQPLLAPEYNATLVYVRSTNLNRTIMSAQSQLMGLFPPPTGPTVPESLADVAVPPITVQKEVNIVNGLQGKALPFQFQSTPVHVFPYLDDFVLLPNAACYNLLVYTYTSAEVKAAYANISMSNPWLLAGLQEYIPIPIEDIAGNLSTIIDSIYCSQAMGYHLPAFSPQLLENATIAFDQIFSIYFQDDLYIRYGSSWFFRDLAEHLEAVMQGTEPTKFRLYSAHDTTIGGFLAGLQVFRHKQPPFASTLIFEVSKTNGEFTIRILYNDVPLTIGPCQSVECPLQTFIDFLYMRSFVSEDVCLPASSKPWSNMTAGKTDSVVPSSGSSALKWEAWVSILLCAIALLLWVGVCIFARSQNGGVYKKIDDFGNSRISLASDPGINDSRP